MAQSQLFKVSGKRFTQILSVTMLVTMSVYCFRKEYISADPLKIGIPNPNMFSKILSREEQIEKLKSHPKNDGNEYDLLVIGGGATGAGCALDAASRGLKVALVEKYDFSSGTSSKSTKLIHGGIRYLEKAFTTLDWDQYALVQEALHERSIFLYNAPHLAFISPIMIPIYKWWKVPYFWVGVKIYDFLAGDKNTKSSYFLTKAKTLENFPMLRTNDLVGALVYYDGQHNDSRMNIGLILTSVLYGANVANYVEVFEFKKNENGKICGAVVRDCLTGDTWTIAAKGVINATGPFADILRNLDSSLTPKMLSLSSGTHIILPGYYSSPNIGFIDPSTSDGRVIFFLPWQGNTLIGTTDSPTKISFDPTPKEEEISWILSEVKKYLSPEFIVRREDVLAAWSGIRPLVHKPGSKDTRSLIRSHIIDVSDSGLLTISGGKWTTYRRMAEDTIDRAIKEFNLKPSSAKCLTQNVQLIGASGWSDTLYVSLIRQFGIDLDISKYLSENYGDRASSVLNMSKLTGKRGHVRGIRLSDKYPFIDGEVRYAVRMEYAQTCSDVLARRTRLAFLDVLASLDALPKVIDIMSEELNWSETRKELEWKNTIEFLCSMGLSETMRNLTRADVENGNF
ncbi:hypothetical protein PNEG_03324 [Pneumocystis murina B123]|uniref:Glycerol-3-phosphate dehydrogenase n=1 Tax=Pneumocystis murina (strain B123) TaxID=1069680 RepID=M7NIS1_PNEMU|nr:hypothetical protein PNEG_03324 [Pneumocystis murina B123]EMR08498.1 hypothetical protein PNEG_03324 [Pneumocystis murina B123]